MPFAITEGEVRSLSVLTNPTNPIIRPYGINTYRNLVNSYQVIYRTQPNVRTVVEFQARQIAQLIPSLIEQISEVEARPATDHGLNQLLHSPHPRWSRHKFYKALASDLLVFDNFVGVKIRKPGTRNARALHRIPPQYIYPLGGDWLTADGFQIMGTGAVFAWDDVVHLNGYNPEDARWGLSPIETLRRILAEDLAASEAREQFWERATRMSGWISRPVDAPDWAKPGVNNAPSARDRFLNSWTDRMTSDGPEAGSTPVLEEGMEFHPETFDAAAAQYVQARELSGIETSRAYHLHPSLLGFQDAAAEAQDSNRRALLSDNLAPQLDFIAGELKIQLLPDFETSLDALSRYNVAFDLEDKLRGDFLAEAEATSRAVGGPWMLRNEARARRNLPPIDGGDTIITPLNVTTGGRANPTDTAPGTPGLGQASRRGIRALPAPAVKALTDLPSTFQPWATQHAAIVASNVDRQAQRVNTRLGVGHDITSAFNKDRSDSELGDDLAGLALEFAPVAASSVASTFGIDYDVAAAEAWLINNARIAAENYNSATLNALTAAESSGDTDTREGATAVFADASGARADAFGIDRVGTISGFAGHDAAQQGGATRKTWETNSANPRPSHADLDGTTIPIGEDFDIGAAYPHAPELDSDESAGCTCTLTYQ